MALTTLTTDLNYHQAQDDNPNDVGGLTPAQFKAVCDQGVNDIKTYLNNTHIPELDGEHIPMQYGVGGGQTISEAIAGATTGTLPDGSITPVKVESGFLNDLMRSLPEISPVSADEIPVIDTSGAVSGRSSLAAIFSVFGPVTTEAGYYIGTGTNGINSANSLTFSSPCQLLLLYSSAAASATDRFGILPVFSYTGSYVSPAIAVIYSSGAYLSAAAKKSSDGKTVYWYVPGTGQASTQFNASGVRYDYIAFLR